MVCNNGVVVAAEEAEVDPSVAAAAAEVGANPPVVMEKEEAVGMTSLEEVVGMTSLEEVVGMINLE